MSYRVLVVDSDRKWSEAITKRLTNEGIFVHSAYDTRSALEESRKEAFNLAILSESLLDISGKTLLDRLHEQVPEGRAMILAGPSAATEGRPTYPGIVSRFSRSSDLGDLLSAVRATLASDATGQESRRRYGLSSLIGESAIMKSVFALVGRVARSEASTIFLRGETGTGKDAMARSLHYESGRVDGPFVTVMCTAIQDTLLEDDLFGHEKGAFTDARAQKKGVFEVAQGGTIFLNEIGDMGAHLQSKLLRVLDEQVFRRVGGTEDIRVDVRVVAATNRELELLIREGRFRADLFYRLNIFPITLPPLRERREDIPFLTEQFLSRFNRKYRKAIAGLRPGAAKRFQDYDWPGNVRELRNVLERATLLSTGELLEEEDLTFWRLGAPADASPISFLLPPGGTRLDDVERSLVEQALDRSHGNQKEAARLLGITRYRLRTRLRRFGLRLGHSHPQKV